MAQSLIGIAPYEFGEHGAVYILENELGRARLSGVSLSQNGCELLLASHAFG